MQENRPNNLKNFFIKLVSITLAILIVFNVVFNLILAERIEKVDKIFSVFESSERKNLKDRFLSELSENLEKDNLLKEEDKIILFKAYKKIQKEFNEIEKKGY
ncbi:MAG: hypothetical protein CBD63_02070 [Candidatus Pelagibacter sp. TMED203]|nr:MAG: hypothetical protein CBD63_02070 [Candidatus Pelagibacter sp. TMED203]|tara:strand:+ start:6767 stop:7075 length:309 start_codon:yes stop_codon:yes gene_type:complete